MFSKVIVSLSLAFENTGGISMAYSVRTNFTLKILIFLKENIYYENY